VGFLDTAGHGGRGFTSGFACQLFARGLILKKNCEKMGESEAANCKDATPCHRWTCVLFAWYGPLDQSLVAYVFGALNAHAVAESERGMPGSCRLNAAAALHSRVQRMREESQSPSSDDWQRQRMERPRN
jgi:hypothetical protein